MNLVMRFNKKTNMWEIGYYYPKLVLLLARYVNKYSWYKILEFTNGADCCEYFHYLMGGNSYERN